MAAITIHHLDHSRSHRIIWLLEELEEDYEIREYRRDPDTMRAPRSLKEIHPLGKAPVVTTQEGDVLAESGAILEELVDRFDGRLRPEAGTEAFRRYRFFMHYAEGSLMPPLLIKLITNLLREGREVPFFLRPIPRAVGKQLDSQFTDGEIETNFSFLDGEFAARTFAVGEEFTAADIQLTIPLKLAGSRVDLRAYPHIQRYLEQVGAREAFQRTLEIGGPLSMD